MWNSYIRVAGAISSKTGSFAKYGSLAMMLLISYDVFSRYLFNRPSLISDEISAYLIVFVCFLGAADTLKENKHIIVDVVTLQLSPKVQLWLKLATHVLSLIFLIVFTWGSIIMVYHSYIRNVTMPTILLTPIWIPQMIIPVGCILLCFQFLIEIGNVLKEIQISLSKGDEKR